MVEGRDDGAVRQHRFQTQHHVAHHAVADDAVAAGIGGDVAADGGRAARAQIEREQQALGIGRLARRLQRAAGLDRHGGGDAIDLQHPVHALQRQRQRAIGIAAFDQARLAAPGHDRLPGFVAQAQHGGDLSGIGGTQHGERRAHAAPAMRLVGGLGAFEHAGGPQQGAQLREKVFPVLHHRTQSPGSRAQCAAGTAPVHAGSFAVPKSRHLRYTSKT